VVTKRWAIATISVGYVDQIKEMMKMSEAITRPSDEDESKDLLAQDLDQETEERNEKYPKNMSNENPFSGMILHPGMVNDPRLQRSHAPSVNGLGTALSLAKVCDFFVKHSFSNTPSSSATFNEK